MKRNFKMVFTSLLFASQVFSSESVDSYSGLCTLTLFNTTPYPQFNLSYLSRMGDGQGIKPEIASSMDFSKLLTDDEVQKLRESRIANTVYSSLVNVGGYVASDTLPHSYKIMDMKARIAHKERFLYAKADLMEERESDRLYKRFIKTDRELSRMRRELKALEKVSTNGSNGQSDFVLEYAYNNPVNESESMWINAEFSHLSFDLKKLVKNADGSLVYYSIFKSDINLNRDGENLEKLGAAFDFPSCMAIQR